jgi:hypothetical protein
MKEERHKKHNNKFMFKLNSCNNVNYLADCSEPGNLGLVDFFLDWVEWGDICWSIRNKKSAIYPSKLYTPITPPDISSRKFNLISPANNQNPSKFPHDFLVWRSKKSRRQWKIKRNEKPPTRINYLFALTSKFINFILILFEI